MNNRKLTASIICFVSALAAANFSMAAQCSTDIAQSTSDCLVDSAVDNFKTSYQAYYNSGTNTDGLYNSPTINTPPAVTPTQPSDSNSNSTPNDTTPSTNPTPEKNNGGIRWY